MLLRRLSLLIAATASAVLAPAVAGAQGAPGDALLQAPTAAAPQRGSVAGAMSALSFGAADLARGSFSLPLPLALPTERAALPADVLPTYSIENGLSEWGIGWGSALTIERYRIRGTVDYQEDDFTSPWGRLVAGDSGVYYTTNLQPAMRLRRVGDSWIALAPDGTTYTFAPAVENASGIYSWQLTTVESLLGARARFVYGPAATTSGAPAKPLLKQVTYGPIEDPTAYRVTLIYEAIEQPFVEYRSGYPLSLNARVARVDVDVKNARTAAYQGRWSYALSYREAFFGPSFYLDSLTRTYAAGESEPPIVFEYDIPEEPRGSRVYYRTAGIEPAPEVEELLTLAADTDILSPQRSTFVDADEDGTTDIESGQTLTLYRQQGDHWEVIPADSPAANVERLCRPSGRGLHGGRSLIRFAGPSTELQVLALDPYSSATELTVCDRAGTPLHRETLEGRWELDTNTKIVDLNRDGRPDLVRIHDDEYEVQENISGDGCGPGATGTCTPLGFRARPRQPLAYLAGSAYDASGSWFHDMNGDGLADLVRRFSDGVSVWYGRGSFEFDPQEHQLLFVNRSSRVVSELERFRVSWVDVNKDSLTDALLDLGQEMFLFINEGTEFREVRVQAFDDAVELDWHLAPVAADLRGTGDTEILFAGLEEAYAIAVDSPSTGLLSMVDDGKGTVIYFDYERAAPHPGMLQRPSVLRSMRLEGVGYNGADDQYHGYDPLVSTYTYGGPVVHTQGHFLVGFGSVSATSAGSIESASFINDDDTSGLIDRTDMGDTQNPSLLQFHARTYETANHDGVALRRLSREQQGYCSAADGRCTAGQTVAEEVTYQGYQRAVCPTRVTRTSQHGVLTVTHKLAAPTNLTDALHCLSSETRWTGAHASSALDFDMTQLFELNAYGQLDKLTVSSADGTLVLQDATFNPSTHRLTSLTLPTGASSTFEYASDTGLIQRTIEGDGVTSRVAARDPGSDAIQQLTSSRGPGGELTASFAYDGFERLDRNWTSFGGSSEESPLAQYAYQWPSIDHPGLIRLSELVASPQEGQSLSKSEQAVWHFPNGEELADAERLPTGWAFGQVNQISRTERAQKTSSRSPGSPTFTPEAATYTILQSGTTEQSAVVNSAFAHVSSSSERVAAGVTRRTAQTLTLQSGALVYREIENPDAGGVATTRGVDAGGRLLWAEDPLSNRTSYAYDALGRLREARLADGTLHQLTYDNLGRPAKIHRQDVGWITYQYDSTTGLLAFRDFFDTANNPASANATPERSSAFLHDSIGRVTQVVHRLEASEQTDAFTFRYDGALGNNEVIAGQRGYLTQAEGPDFKRTTLYNPDDSIASTTHEIGDWIVVAESSDYHAGGQLAGWHREVRRAGTNELIDQIDLAYLYDAWGRLERILLGEQLLATLHYDARGRFDYADLAGGQKLAHFYDPETLQQNGYQRDIGTGAEQWTTAVGWQRDERGLIDYETFSAADTSWRQDYAYDARRFLQTSTDGQDQSAYAYTTTGLPSTVTDLAGTRRVDRGDASELTVDGNTYAWDAQGRIIRKGNLELLYGPNGDVATARVDGRTIDYRYDDGGQRLLKLENGAPIAAFLGGSYITADDALTPIHIMGSLVGYVRGGNFQLLSTDPRGTLLAEDDGTRSPVTPFGVRLQRPELAAALDYVEKAYDPDLRSIRMGARDYDPLLSQFQTPDPLYLEQLDKCAESPIECNLYGYSLNNPLLFIDPSGLDAFSWLGNAARGFGGAAYDAGAGLYQAGRHPVRTAKAIGSAVAHPVRTGTAVYESVKATASAVAAGDPEAIGAAVFEIASMAVGVGTVTKAAQVTKLTKLTKLGKAGQAATRTGTVWDLIKATQPVRAGTAIPKSFEVATAGKRFWVHPNATKHMAEFITRNGPSTGMPINSQTMLSSFQASVESAVKTGVKFGEPMQIGRWELIFSAGRGGDALPVIKHALYR